MRDSSLSPPGQGTGTASLRERIDSMLSAHTTLTLATTGKDGSPAAAAVFYAPDAELNLYFLSEERTLHGQNLSRNPLVAATIQACEQDWRTIRGLQLRGYACLVPLRAVAQAARIYAARYAFVEPLLGSLAGRGLARGDSKVLSAPLARARFWVLRPDWFRLIDNTVGFGHKEELMLTEEGWHAT